MSDFQELAVQKLPRKFRQDRIYLLCQMHLPNDVRDKMPQAQVQQCHGRFLLGFSYLPQVGDRVPYQGQVWELVKPPLQFPHRYNSKQEKRAAVALFRWVGSYGAIEDFEREYLSNAEV